MTVQDGRSLVGTFLAFDKHLNLVLSDTEEYRVMQNSTNKLRNIVEERQEKRLLGLIILRGENVVSIAVEGPPPTEQRPKLMPGGPGISKGVGRGMPPPPAHGGMGSVPMGLGMGAVPGIGGPAFPPPPPGMGRGGFLPPPPR